MDNDIKNLPTHTEQVEQVNKLRRSGHSIKKACLEVGISKQDYYIHPAAVRVGAGIKQKYKFQKETAETSGEGIKDIKTDNKLKPELLTYTVPDDKIVIVIGHASAVKQIFEVLKGLL